MTLAASLASAFVIGYLPGALLFRLPIAQRPKRAALSVGERVFWRITISLVWTLALVLGLAAAGVYRFEWVLAANLILSAILLSLGRSRLRWGGEKAPISAWALLPSMLVAAGLWLYFPPFEYVMGGKDPGTYINEGLAIDRTGALFRRDKVVADVPAGFRDLFFPSHNNAYYYGIRFMDVFINDPGTGEVIAGHPHLYPASVAVGYHLAGINGAVGTSAVWAILGLLAVYFLGARLVSRLPAFAATLALALNVVEVWFGRYPNTEVVMQALLFAAMLAVARSHVDEDPFFSWIAGATCALLIFLRFDAFLAIAGISGALALLWIATGRRPDWGFVVPVTIGTVLGLAYYVGPMRWYFFVYEQNLPPLGQGLAMLAGLAVAVAALGRLRPRIGRHVERIVPVVLASGLIALAIYGLFLREPGGKLAIHDAYALRTFREAYVFWPALAAALVGCWLVVRREFWRAPAFFAVFAGFSFFFFYKIRVVPDQFWMARRFLPVVLPGVLLLAAGAALGRATKERPRTKLRAIGGAVLMIAIGWQYVVAARPIASHVEYEGAIAAVQSLARRFTDRDLVLFEGRNADSDFHVLAIALTDQFGLNTLVIDSPRPDRRLFASFLADALRRYERVFFVGGGGTDLLSAAVAATPVASPTVFLPEYETTPWNQYPKSVRRKDLSYAVFRLTLDEEPRYGFDIDVGYFDDLNVVRFYARESTEGRTFRWTRRQSFIAATGLAGDEQEVALELSAGGRPAEAPPATLEVFFNGTLLGRLEVAEGFRIYRLAIPAALVRDAAASPDPAELRLLSSTWVPHDIDGGPDTRELGVMVDRVEIH